MSTYSIFIPYAGGKTFGTEFPALQTCYDKNRDYWSVCFEALENIG